MSDKIKIAIDAMSGENSPIKIVDGIEISLRLNKNKSGYEFKIIDDLNKHFITFRAVLWLWRFINDPGSSYIK